MNQLSKETSPYLLQHAHNPVHWYAWKPEAFEKARREDKPILVSIGYSTCHWCHVMERESFENQSVADFMNTHFVCIKVDREERPDVDQIYMEACQLVSGSGGWPLNCFLTPDTRPFFAGTYYPPMPSYGRPSWQQVLQNMAAAFSQKRDVVEEQADKLTGIIRDADKNYVKKMDFDLKNSVYTEGSFFSEMFNQNLLDKIYHNLKDRFDTEEGGFGGAPKFPSTMSIQYLLDYYFYTKNEDALKHAELSLEKMIQGGIYDQIGGGFARYATDRAWLIPHFEKMLYDNALLIQVIADAYKLTKKDIYRETIEETLAFILREMTLTQTVHLTSDNVHQTAFFSAYDADSEGVEGKFYVWTKVEIEAILGEDAPVFCTFYDVTEEGNWEEHTILWRANSYENFSKNLNINILELKKNLKISCEKLYAARSKRIKPSLDDKILLSWNALMISAFAKAYEALYTDSLSRPIIGRSLKIAVQALDFILDNFKNPEGGFFHTYKNGQAQYAAFLEDYAYLIEALLDVYGVTFDAKYLQKAKELTDFTIENFGDDADSLFYFTSKKQTDILLRKKDLYDSATPSGNATMMKNLGRLAIIFDNSDYKNRHFAMLQTIAESLKMYPSSFSKWASGAIAAVHPPFEIAVLGDDFMDKSMEINALFIPNKTLMASARQVPELPLLDRYTEGSIFLCQNYACQLPVQTVGELVALIHKP
jgi:uncharacterized protein